LSDVGMVYLATPVEFLTHYNLSLLRKDKPKLAKDLTFVAVDLDSYLMSDGLFGMSIPIDGIISKEHNIATYNLVNTALKVLAENAQKEVPFYKGYSYEKITGFTYPRDFYSNCLEAWKALNPANKALKDNPAFHQFMSIVINFVEALHNCHPDTHYNIKDGRIVWVDGKKVQPFPVQQIIEARHGIKLSFVEPVAVNVSLFSVFKHAKNVLFKSTSPELYSSQMLNMYGIEEVSGYEKLLTKKRTFSFFVSESIMVNSLIARAFSADDSKQFIVYSGSRVIDKSSFIGSPTVFLDDESVYDDYTEISSYKDAIVVLLDTPATALAEASILRKISSFAKTISVEIHLDPLNVAFRNLANEKCMGLLFSSQDEINFLLRKYSRAKLVDARNSFQYDNRSVAVDVWQEKSTSIDVLCDHYEQIRCDVASVFSLDANELSKMFKGVEINEGNIANARDVVHAGVLSRLKTSSSFISAINALSPTNKKLGKNVWDPSLIYKESLL